MTGNGDQPQAESSVEESPQKQNRWNRACMALGCWFAASIRKADNFPVYLTAIFTGLLAVFAFYAWVEATRGTRAMQGQLETARADQRAWIGQPKVEIERFLKTQVIFIIGFQNIGHTPTLGIDVDAEVVASSDVIHENKTFCDRHREQVARNGDDFHGYSVIPGSTFRVRRANIEIADLKKIIKPHLVGCAVYGSRLDSVLHKTGFVAPILFKDGVWSAEYVGAGQAD